MDYDAGSRSSFGGAFRPYNRAAINANLESSRLNVVVRRPLVARLTKDLVETFKLCNPYFKYSEVLNPKRFLTNPSVGVLNDGYDNANSDLILHVNTVLVNSTTNQRYHVKDVLGQGTFGQVAKCWVPENDGYVAVKVIKNHAAYYRQSLVEVSILMTLNQKLGHDEKRHIVRILDYFMYQRHLCISFEMLGSNLYELIKLNQYRGFPISIVQAFSKQILHALVVIKEAGIIHCDLKPENILLSTSAKPEIKVIDFGSACREGHTVYSYIQSRYYRSPEVLLGFPYTTAIDMWSFGCIVAELFLGLPLFSGASEYDLLKRMADILGGQPPDYLLREAKETDKFFKQIASMYRLVEDGASKGTASPYQMLTEEEFEARGSKKPIIGKRYFSHVKLEDIITNYPYRKKLSEEEISKEKDSRKALADFLKGLVEFDPGKRWSPLQASRHPFVTGEPFICPYQPPQETPRISVVHAVTVDHNPGGGHWLAAGLSPQVPSSNRCIPHNSPHFQMVSLPHGSSFGSLGSHGSYNDNIVLGSSYGSYGDVNSMYSYFSPVAPSGLNIQTQVGGPFLGASPDTRRGPHMSHGNGFGASPNGCLGPMSLGASPSQFTPPSSQMQIPTVSPGKYGPTSPARGSVHGSPFGKGGVAGHGQYNRRRSWGYPGASSMQPHENASQHWQGYHGDGISCQSEAIGRSHVGSTRGTISASNHSNWRQQPSSSSQTVPVSSICKANAVSLHSTEVSCDKHEGDSSLPDPADWDPNYSDEQLLQEDNSEINSLAFGLANNISLGNATNIFVPSEIGKSGQAHRQARTNSNFVSSNQRTDGPFQAYSHTEGSPHFAHDVHAGPSRLPPFSQNTPTRFGQQSAHRHHRHSTYMHSEGIYHKGQPARGNFAVEDLHSAPHNMMGNGVSWGRRGGHPIATTQPSSMQGRSIMEGCLDPEAYRHINPFIGRGRGPTMKCNFENVIILYLGFFVGALCLIN